MRGARTRRAYAGRTCPPDEKSADAPMTELKELSGKRRKPSRTHHHAHMPHRQKAMYECAKVPRSRMEADGSRFMEVNKTYLDIKPKESTGAGRLAWLGHLPDTQKVAGSSPARPTILLDAHDIVPCSHAR
jgi:hypothetical protein